MFKERLSFALALIKENIAYYIVLAIAIVLGITVCAINGYTTGVITVAILGIISWIGADISVYMNYIHGIDE